MENNQTVTTTTTRTETEQIIKKHVLISMAIGVIPVPYVDMLALTANQVSMIEQLAKHYNVVFSKKVASSTLVSLVSGVGSQALATGTLGSAIKAIPVVGTFIGIVTYPAIAASITYGVGQVYDKHFAEGGDLFNFNPFAKKHELKKEVETHQETTTVKTN